MRVDPSRLSRLLLQLSEPRPAAPTASAVRAEQTRASRPTRGTQNLKSAIKSRLQNLETNDPEYDEKGASIIIQEILIWELGANITAHPDFSNVITSVTTTMRQDEKMARSIKKLVSEMREVSP